MNDQIIIAQAKVCINNVCQSDPTRVQTDGSGNFYNSPKMDIRHTPSVPTPKAIVQQAFNQYVDQERTALCEKKPPSKFDACVTQVDNQCLTGLRDVATFDPSSNIISGPLVNQFNACLKTVRVK